MITYKYYILRRITNFVRHRSRGYSETKQVRMIFTRQVYDRTCFHSLKDFNYFRIHDFFVHNDLNSDELYNRDFVGIHLSLPPLSSSYQKSIQ